MAEITSTTTPRKMRFWCQKVLPLVYDQSLSYYEALCKFSAKLNEVIDWLDSYEDDLKAYVDEKYAENLAEMKAELAAYKTEVDATLDDMGNRLDTIEDSVDAKIAKLEQDVAADIEALNKLTDAKLAENTAYVNSEIAKLTAYVSAQLAVIFQKLTENYEMAKSYTNMRIAQTIAEWPDKSSIYVTDPTGAGVVTIQTALYNMWDKLRYFALTAFQYDTLYLTAEEYDNKGLAAYQYDLWGWWYLWQHSKKLYSFNGVTGEYVKNWDNIYWLYQVDRESGITANEYDTAAQTAETYDNKEITAYNYDWTNAAIA